MVAAKCTADALAYLHGNCIAHGDVYAHNMLEDPHGRTVLCDYGAAFFYHPDERPLWEPVEVPRSPALHETQHAVMPAHANFPTTPVSCTVRQLPCSSPVCS